MTGWHPDADLLRRYTEHAAGIDLAMALESHLTACGRCRRVAASAVPADRLAAVWTGIAAQLDELRPPRTVRVLSGSSEYGTGQVTPPDPRRDVAGWYYTRMPWTRSAG